MKLIVYFVIINKIHTYRIRKGVGEHFACLLFFVDILPIY
jgi:hypothetical protein